MVVYTGPDQKRRKRSFARKVQAEAFLAETSTAVHTGEWTDPALGRITIQALHDEWMPTQTSKSDRYYRQQKSVAKNHILPRFGHRTLASITTPDVEQWITDMLTEGRSAEVVLQAHGVFKRLVDYGVRGDRVRRNRVAAAANLPRKTQARHNVYLTHAQTWQLAEAALTADLGPGAAGHATRLVMRAMLLVSAYTGLRFGELIGLDVTDFDPRRNRLMVDKQYDGDPLKDHAKRTVPLPRAVSAAITASLGGRVSGVLFPSPRGSRWAYKRYRIWFDAAAKKAGIIGLTPHDLRHTAASLAVQAGASVKALQAMLGHESATLTLDTYSDLFDGDLDDVAARLDAIVDGLPGAGTAPPLDPAAPQEPPRAPRRRKPQARLAV